MATKKLTWLNLRRMARAAVFEKLNAIGYTVSKDGVKQSVYIDKVYAGSKRRPLIVVNHEMGFIGPPIEVPELEEAIEAAGERISRSLKKYGYSAYFEPYDNAVTILSVDKL